VAIPPEGIAEAFNYMVEPLFQRISANIEAAKLLMGVRDTLLPRLIGGKLRLPECQEELREMIA
jgi:type I restriction enzyme S subunit